MPSISRKKAVTGEERLARRRAAVKRYDDKMKAVHKAPAYMEKRRAWDAARYVRDKEKRIAAAVLYRASRREHIREVNKEYYVLNREVHSAKCAAYYQQNRSTILAKVAAYRETNPIAVSLLKRKRKAQQKTSIPAWFSELDRFVMAEAAALCLLREHATGFKWHMDHVVPLQSNLVCGLHIAANIAVIPAAVNRSKKNRYWPNMP